MRGLAPRRPGIFKVVGHWSRVNWAIGAPSEMAERLSAFVAADPGGRPSGLALTTIEFGRQ